MNILAIDLGYFMAVTLIQNGKVYKPKELDMRGKLGLDLLIPTKQWIEEILSKHEIDEIIVEQPYIRDDCKMAFEDGQLGVMALYGLIALICAEHQIKFTSMLAHEVTWNLLKVRYIGREVKKRLTIEAIKLLHSNWTDLSQHQIDSLSIAHTALLRNVEGYHSLKW